ncbi:uncharacterized protein HaLaN_06315, partial [Haematococcus lacustris]
MRDCLEDAQSFSGAVKRALEDELRDPRTPLEYLAPRPVRLALCYCCAASCGLALLLGIVSLVTASPSLDSLVTSSEGALSDPLRNLLVNALGLAAFVGLARADAAAGEAR